jgi:hypothetical protein
MPGIPATCCLEEGRMEKQFFAKGCQQPIHDSYEHQRHELISQCWLDIRSVFAQTYLELNKKNNNQTSNAANADLRVMIR